MTVDDILNALPTKEDIAAAVGLQSRTSTSADLLNALGIFGTGLILGAGLALLLTPKRGDEIRQDIAEKAEEIGQLLRQNTQSPTTPSA